MNSMLEEGLLSAADNSVQSGMAPAVILVPMLNTGHAPEILQLATMLAGRSMEDGNTISGPGFVLDSPLQPARIVVLSIVQVPPDEPLTMGLDMARSYRALLDFLPSEVEAGGRQGHVDRMVKVARDVAAAIHQAAYEEHADLLLLHWKGYAREPKRHLYGRITDAVLRKPPCSVMLARLEGWDRSRRIFLPVRGGPAAEQALHIGVTLAERLCLPVTVMHNVPPSTGEGPKADVDMAECAGGSQVEALGEEPYIVFNEQLRHLQKDLRLPVESILTRRPDPVQALLDEAHGDDLLIMGLPALIGGSDPTAAMESSVALRVSATKGPPLLLLSTPASIDLASYTRKVRASRSRKRWADMPFEHWFVEHTYHGVEFKDPEEFMKAKQASGLTMSVAVLTSNDGNHIHSVLTGLKRVLTELHPIADQIAVVDAGSTDDTIAIARSLGVEVYQAGDILPAQGDLHGRGECWWKSLAVLRGDILVWLDPRARRFHPGTALSLAGPLLRNSSLKLVKAFGQTESAGGNYGSAERRADDFSPLDMSWGGFVVPHRDAEMVSEKVRVQALRPSDLASLSAGQIAMLPPRTLLQVLNPSLAALIAPFSRDMAGRREAMMQLPAFAGENVELGLLLSVAVEYGTNAIAQVELRHHQPSLPPAPSVRSAIDVLQVIARRLQDVSMRRHTEELVERLHNEIEGKRSSGNGASSAGLFEVRALGPVERPPMRNVLSD